jgi:DNA-binding MarR family transcriptional regulator
VSQPRHASRRQAGPAPASREDAAPVSPGPAATPAEEAKATEGKVRLGKLESYLGFNLRLAQEASFQAFWRRTGESDLRPGRFAILVLIGENPGISQTALGAAAGRDKSTLTPALTDLERRGLIHRSRAAHDRRSYALSLTEEGWAVLRKLSVHAAAHDRQLDELVGPENKDAFMAILRRITTGLG